MLLRHTYIVCELLTDPVEIKKRSAEEGILQVMLLRQLPWIVTKQQVFVDNAWQACPIVPLNVTTLHETGQHMTMHDLLLTKKLVATAIINGMSKKTIPAHEEILWNYGGASSYIYPTFD